MLSKVQKTIKTHKLLEGRHHILVGVSGGADSVALTYALRVLRRHHKLKLTLAHLNHGIRGDEATADAEFVDALASRLGVSCLQERANVPAIARKKGVSLEMAGREARYRFFAHAARSVGADCAATAHNADDQVETVLLKLARGAGMQGLGGIAYQVESNGLCVIRPLLDITHREAVTFLSRKGIAWREDTSNRDQNFLRNRIRHEILPLLEARLNPRLRGSVLRLAEVMREEHAWLDGFAQEILNECENRDDARSLNLKKLGGYPLAARRRVVQLWLRQKEVGPTTITFDAVDRIINLMHVTHGSRGTLLAGGWKAVRRYASLFLERAASGGVVPFRLPLKSPGETMLLERGLRVVVQPDTGFIKQARARVGALPAHAWLEHGVVGRARLYLRSWQAGDRFRPMGMRGTKKVQDILVDRKMPRDQRLSVPILECRGEIVWVPGYSVAEGWQVKDADSPSFHVCIEQL